MVLVKLCSIRRFMLKLEELHCTNFGPEVIPSRSDNVFYLGGRLAYGL